MIVIVNLDKPRPLKYTASAFKEMDQAAALSGRGNAWEPDTLSSLDDLLTSESDFVVIQFLLWGGLKWADKSLTIDKVEEILTEFVTNGGQIEPILKKIIIAYRAFRDQGKSKKKKKKRR